MANNTTQKRNIRIPPQSLDSERAVLGSIMLRPGAIYEIADQIAPESFYAEKHAIVFRTMLELNAKSEPIDLLSVSSKLKEKKVLEQIGGSSFLSELANSVPMSTNVKHYADIVQKKHLLRGLIDSGEYISELGFSEADEEIESILDKAEKKVFGVVSSPKGQKFTHIKEALPEAWERLERLHENKGEMRGVSSGFADLDSILAGFQKSDLIILAARPSVGKTTLALDIARNVAKQNVPVFIFSLEMSKQQLVDTMMAAESKVNAWKLRNGKLTTDSEFQLVRDSLDRLSKAPIFMDDQSSNNIMNMRSVARRVKAEHGLGLIIIDYLQLMATSKNYDNMVNQVTEISRSLKGLARELDVPVIALSQLSRAVEARGGRPRLSDLRDSGSIEQDADVVMFIHREDKYKDKEEKNNIAEILVEKHRNGPVGKIELYFDEDRRTFVSIDKNLAGMEGYVPMAKSALDEF